MVLRDVYGRHVCILRMLWVLSSFPHPPHVFVPVLRARRLPLHAFAPALLAHLLLEGVVQDVQILIPFLSTFCRSRVVVELECDDDISKTDQLGETICLLSRQRDQTSPHWTGSRVTCIDTC